MKFDLRDNKDFLAGLLFIAIGGLAVAIARDYPMGSAVRMGPGYFPTVLGGLLCLFGVYVLVRGLRSGEKFKGEWGWKPLALIALSIVLFGFLMDRLGIVPALVATFFVGAFAGREFRFTEVLLLTAVMGAFAVGVFVFGLKLPYPLFPGVLWTF
ncbi:MAG: tripartite tricarboxylate transporter TctB family protein [Betaproteobacteria bacterium]|nr:tripartite tricarboxylate transporter TctB family protein [Betaproteobacteria bacterium]